MGLVAGANGPAARQTELASLHASCPVSQLSASVKDPPAKCQPALIPSRVGTPGKVVCLHRAAEWSSACGLQVTATCPRKWQCGCEKGHCRAWQAGWQPAKRPPLQMRAAMGSTCQPGTLQGAAPAWLHPHSSCSMQYTSSAYPPGCL